jgi:hypothetical protein
MSFFLQGGCSKNAANGGDFVADTPAVASPNFKCARTDSCPGLPGVDLVNNYMVSCAVLFDRP